MANPIQIYYSGTTTNAPTLGIGATQNNIGLNGPDKKLFYFDGTTTQSFSLGNIGAGNFGNLNLAGNTVSTTDLNGNLLLSPNGTGSIDAATSSIINVVDPTLAQDAATKAYVDSVAVGLLDFKNSVRAASTVNVNLAATTGGASQDGLTLADGENILLKNQTAPAENGIYTATTAANPSTWVRRSDANTSAEVTSGMFCFISEGTANGGDGYVLSTADPITLDTTALTFVKFSTQGAITGTASRITVTGTAVNIASTYVGQTSITTLGTITSGTWNGTVIDQANGGTGADMSAVVAGSIIRNNAGGTALEAAIVDTDYLAPASLIGGQTF